MDKNSAWIWAGLFLMMMLCTGYWLGLQRAVSRKPRIPTHWPLHPRVPVNADELRVWRWLTKTFDDHHVMIKMPVTRFTRPNASENGKSLYELLKNTSCTFSVCADDGHVVGCIDVPKHFDLPRKARILKENLLAQCGISYIVLHAERLPSPEEMRNEFLGEVAARVRYLKREEAVVETARISLKKTLMQQRKMREPRAVHAGPDGFSSGVPSQWHDSFLIQANSLPAELRTANGIRLA